MHGRNRSQIRHKKNQFVATKNRDVRAQDSCYVELMKICSNAKCAMFGRIVYALATRCPVCRWDLKSPAPAAEASAARPAQTVASTR